MRATSLLALAVAAALTIGLSTGAPGAAAADRNCEDFTTQKEAQEYFLSKGGPDEDPDRLDQDNDGVACESLPCPCKGAPNRDLLISIAFLVALLIGDGVYFRWRRPRIEARLGVRFESVARFLVILTLCALVSVVNFALSDPLIDNFVAWMIGVAIATLGTVVLEVVAPPKGDTVDAGKEHA